MLGLHYCSNVCILYVELLYECIELPKLCFAYGSHGIDGRISCRLVASRCEFAPDVDTEAYLFLDGVVVCATLLVVCSTTFRKFAMASAI